jgi:hypothetical protein
VRLWWVLGLGVLVITLCVVVGESVRWWSEKRLLARDDNKVIGTIVQAQTAENTMTLPGRKMASDSIVTIEFEWRGQKHTVSDVLSEHVEKDEPVITGSNITLHVDPDDPEQRWTARTTTPPFGARELMGAAVGAPIVLVLAILAVLKRRRVLDVWANGQAMPAHVLGVGQSPVAPRSRSLKCTMGDARDKRVFTVFVPSQAVSAGDEVWVVRMPDKIEPTLAATWFDRGESVAASASTNAVSTSAS